MFPKIHSSTIYGRKSATFWINFCYSRRQRSETILLVEVNQDDYFKNSSRPQHHSYVFYKKWKTLKCWHSVSQLDWKCWPMQSARWPLLFCQMLMSQKTAASILHPLQNGLRLLSENIWNCIICMYVKLTVTKHLYIGSLVFTFFQDIIYYFCATRHTVVLLHQLSLFVFVCILYMDGWGTETLTFLLKLTEKSCETQKKKYSALC